MVKQLPLIPLLEQFIKESANGTRRKINGERILAGTIKNYKDVLRLLKDYQEHTKEVLLITVNIRNNCRLLLREKKYWQAFYRHYSDFLLYTKGFYDNYVGANFKWIKCFFRYLKNEKLLFVQDCFEKFYVRREEIRVISLLPEQYCFLVLDKEFEQKLNTLQRTIKDLFVFGCTAALRFSDLKALRVKDVEYRCGKYYLIFRSIKTDIPVQVKLPQFAINIYLKYARRKQPHQTLFRCNAASNFNKQLKKIGEMAGWTEIVGKQRTKNGRPQEIQTCSKRLFRFCDYFSSHLMRKTGITVLLMLGMPEYLVRKISGHASHSKEFFRYVNLAQSYISDEID